jgi:hypothetical protein
MKDAAILLPALSLVGWTLLVLLLVLYRRFKAAFAGQVKSFDYAPPGGLCREHGRARLHVDPPDGGRG